MINKIRYFLITFIAGDMPVVLNMNVARPKGFKGNLAHFPHPEKPGIFSNNMLCHKHRDSILTPKRDVDVQTSDL